MKIENIKFKGDGCFSTEWAGFDAIKPITVIIGRNNTGKSQLLDLVRLSCEKLKKDSQWEYSCTSVLTEQALRGLFHENVSDGDLPGNHWVHHGRHLIGSGVKWKVDRSGDCRDVVLSVDERVDKGPTHTSRMQRVGRVVANAEVPFYGRRFCHLLADRDIRPEKATKQLQLSPDGVGATNIIRRLLVSSSSRMPRDLIQSTLRNALNEIFASDGEFLEIEVQLHDEGVLEGSADQWEVFLAEAHKGLIPLSRSGSGLKTVILVLLQLLVVPAIEEKPAMGYVFAFEELENNLHPALLRRLLRYIEDFAMREKTNVYLTTHSSVSLDLFGASPGAQIVHVVHDGKSATTSTVSAHFDKLSVIGELGAKPSDLLQANGIIWVEGPSDAVYVSRWIDLLSNGELREGRDYLCAFYGGALLARTQFVAPEDAEAELINLISLNPNVALVCDSDKDSVGKQLKPRVRRIRAEVEKIPGAVTWITGCREMENYIPGEVLGKSLGIGAKRDPEMYESFFPREKTPGESYLETQLGRAGIDKVELAALCCANMELDKMRPRFDWVQRMSAIVDAVRRWKS